MRAQTQRIIEAFDSRRLIEAPGLDEPEGYAVARELHAHRLTGGARPVGRKIGFTNRAIWAQYAVFAPIWAYMYDTTVAHGTTRIAVDRLLQPKIEPEIILHFARTPPVTGDEGAILECIDWIAFGYELVHCPYPEWGFSAGDSVAAGSLHGALVVGEPVAPAPEWVEALRTFTVTLRQDGEEVATGGGALVLDSPLLAFAHLASVLAEQGAEPVQAGELVTTGTLAAPPPCEPGHTFSAELHGIDLPGLTLTLR